MLRDIQEFSRMLKDAQGCSRLPHLPADLGVEAAQRLLLQLPGNQPSRAPSPGLSWAAKHQRIDRSIIN